MIWYGPDDLRSIGNQMLRPNNTAHGPLGLSGRVALGAVLGRLLGSVRGERHVYIGRYRLGRRLGTGAYGAVYRAFDPDLGRDVALKIIKPHGRRELRRLRARIDREAAALARLRHPNVVGVYDTGQACVDAEGNEGVYLAMELVSGRTLSRWAHDEAPDWRTLMSVYLTAGRALVAAHQVGIIHRDFKPTNVMVADDGTVKVLDFGMARAAGGTDTDTYSAAGGWSENAVTAVTPIVTAADMSGPLLDDALTLSDELMGTPRYMAPEQHDGSSAGSSANHAADQYAFCCSLYEALYARAPFHADSIEGLLEAKEAGLGFFPPSRAVPPAIYRVLRQGMHPDPLGRFRDMQSLLTALQAAMQPRRRRWLLPLVAVSVAAATTALACL